MMKKIYLLLFILLIALLCCSCGDKKDQENTTGTEAGQTPIGEQPVTGNDVTVKSPDGKTAMRIYKNESGNTVYTVSYDGGEIIGESALGVKLSGLDSFDGAEILSCETKQRSVSYAYLGSFSTITDNSNAATIKLKSGDYEFSIQVKAHNDGVAFRYILPSAGSKRSVQNEYTSFKVNNMAKIWYGVGSDCYESEIYGSDYRGVKKNAKLDGPLTIELKKDGGYIVLTEGYVDDSYIGTNYVSTGNDFTFKVSGAWGGTSEFTKFSVDGDIRTGWRVINYSKDLGGIVTNTNVYSTALDFESDSAPDISGYDWVEPGKCTWSWINDRGVPFEPQIDYTVLCSKLGFTYNIIDEGYMSWDGYTTRLKELGKMAGELNVKHILWCWVTGSHNGYQIGTAAAADKIMKTVSGYGLAGVKLDFFANESVKSTIDIEKAALEAAAKYKLVIDFHGIHKPISLSVSYPNELTREGIRGLENMSRYDYNTQARYIVSQFYTRLLAGHADFTPDANNAMQIASLVVLDSPLMVIASDPRDMLANEASEMIKAIPTVWDRTVFLDGKIGSYVSVAKENKGVWYVGGIAGEAVKDAKIDLSKFLGEGEYLMTLWKDKSNTEKEKIEKKVKASDVIDIGNLAKSLGYVASFSKLELDTHGGEIKGDIKVTTASADSAVKYTTDGSDPRTSASAKTCDGKISLTDSCLLRVAIVSGDGEGTEMSYRFNKVVYNTVSINAEYKQDLTVVTIESSLEGAKIYYTTDGKTPSESSILYEGPINVTEKTTIKAISISADGSDKSLVQTLKCTVKKTVPVPTPDIYLGKDYIEAVAGWDDRIMVDESMNRTVISLGGSTTENGQKFAHGISTNAIGYFVYAIPENASRFVGVAGIDDSAYNNTGEGHKASITCVIYIDGAQVYTTNKLGQGEFELIDVEIPEGSKQIKIYFGDAGDGITCDNASLGNGGFILK